MLFLLLMNHVLEFNTVKGQQFQINKVFISFPSPIYHFFHFSFIYHIELYSSFIQRVWKYNINNVLLLRGTEAIISSLLSIKERQEARGRVTRVIDRKKDLFVPRSRSNRDCAFTTHAVECCCRICFYKLFLQGHKNKHGNFLSLECLASKIIL